MGAKYDMALVNEMSLGQNTEGEILGGETPEVKHADLVFHASKFFCAAL